jgi:hypothetical protein
MVFFSIEISAELRFKATKIQVDAMCGNDRFVVSRGRYQVEARVWNVICSFSFNWNQKDDR